VSNGGDATSLLTVDARGRGSSATGHSSAGNDCEDADDPSEDCGGLNGAYSEAEVIANGEDAKAAGYSTARVGPLCSGDGDEDPDGPGPVVNGCAATSLLQVTALEDGTAVGTAKATSAACLNCNATAGTIVAAESGGKAIGNNSSASTSGCTNCASDSVVGAGASDNGTAIARGDATTGGVTDGEPTLCVNCITTSTAQASAPSGTASAGTKALTTDCDQCVTNTTAVADSSPPPNNAPNQIVYSETNTTDARTVAMAMNFNGKSYTLARSRATNTTDDSELDAQAAAGGHGTNDGDGGGGCENSTGGVVLCSNQNSDEGAEADTSVDDDVEGVDAPAP
jgi:hypothetical protein